jgi:hypothetical protein
MLKEEENPKKEKIPNEKPYPEGDVLNEYFRYSILQRSEETLKAHQAIRAMLMEIIKKDELDGEQNVSKK